MKKLISFCIFFFVVFSVNAQSQAETLEWLRAKQPSIRDMSSNLIARGNGKLTIDETSIKLSTEGSSTNIQWDKVKDITLNYSNITIVSEDLTDGNGTFIRLNTDVNISSKFIKALKHMATLKNAKMVKDELF